MDEAVVAVRGGDATDAERLTDVVTAHVGQAAAQLPVVRLEVERHHFVNLDVAVHTLMDDHGGGRVIGVGGGEQRHHQTFGDMLQTRGPWSIPVGAVDRVREDTGPSSSREAVSMGVFLFRYGRVPVAVLQRRGSPQYGQASGLEVLAAAEASEALLADVRRLMLERSVFRGQVLSFGLTDGAYGQSTGGIAFLERPEIASRDVVLPAGALDRIERHVVGIGRHRDALRRAGQHLKRGLLLYGPPGTGKTHTVRYLLGRMTDATCVVVAGNALGLVSAATDLAHALQPSVVVLEDVDLIAEHREYHMGPQPLLFTLLDAMDGLAGDSDVAFVLTTNRADLLETALTQRPGRIDLAAEIPIPDARARRTLLGIYTSGMLVSDAALEATTTRADGMTASFFKELARRSVLMAAQRGTAADDNALTTALDEMLSDDERLTRALVGGTGPPTGHDVVQWETGPGLDPGQLT